MLKGKGRKFSVVGKQMGAGSVLGEPEKLAFILELGAEEPGKFFTVGRISDMGKG